MSQSDFKSGGGRCCRQDSPERSPESGPGETALIERLISALDRPGGRIDGVVVGRFFVGITAGERMGLAATLGARVGPEDRAVIKSLPGSEIRAAARLLLSSSPMTASLGLASLNAGMVPPDFERGPNAEEMIAARGRNREVVVVGHFPFTERLRGVASRLHLLELRDVPGRAARGDWDRILAGCDVAAITSTALLTGSMAYFLGRAEKAHKILLGPSTPLTPVLFREGADALAGSVVLDPEAVRAGIEADGTFRDLKKLGIGFVYLRPGDWPEESE